MSHKIHLPSAPKPCYFHKGEIAIFISDVIDLSRCKPHALNLIVSGCGTGKTYFAKHILLRELGVKPHEAIFVTSRSAIIEQQVADGLIERFSFDDNWKINLWNTGETGTEPDFELQAMTYSDFISLIDQKIGYRSKIFAGIKVFIIDECHALYNDSFIKGVEAMRFVVNRVISETEAIVIGMTATPGILERSKHLLDCELNYLLDEPLFRYKAKNLWIANRNSLSTLLADTGNFPGKSIVMMRTINDCEEEMVNLPNSHLQISRRNKRFDPETMLLVRKTICYKETFPPFALNHTGRAQPVDVMFTTSTLREGINLCPSSGVKNVIVDFQDDIDIIQFLGRCRFDVDNLIILASNYYRDNHKKRSAESTTEENGDADIEQMITAEQYRAEQNASFYDLWYKGKTNWLRLLDNVIEHDSSGCITPRYYPYDLTKYLFYSWFDDNYVSTENHPVMIYTDEQKQEIVDHAISMNMFRTKMPADVTYTAVINSLKSTGMYDIKDDRVYIDKILKRVKIVKRIDKEVQEQ